MIVDTMIWVQILKLTVLVRDVSTNIISVLIGNFLYEFISCVEEVNINSLQCKFLFASLKKRRGYTVSRSFVYNLERLLPGNMHSSSKLRHIQYFSISLMLFLLTARGSYARVTNFLEVVEPVFRLNIVLDF